MKLGVSFDDLLAYDVKYHLKCFNTYMGDSKSDQTSTMHQYCFKLLIRQIDPLLNEAWLLSIAKLLNQFKSILKDNDYELSDSYSSARLKQRLVKYYSLEICFGEEQGEKHTNQFVYTSSISIHEVLNIATNYKRELKDHELIDEPKTKFWNEQQIF